MSMGSSVCTLRSSFRCWLSGCGSLDVSLADSTVQSYLVSVFERPIIAPSAFKHGLKREDILHALRNPIRVWDLGDGFTMMIGPSKAAAVLEVGYIEGDVAVVVVHAMSARERFLR